jgi:hypothetical protein
MAPGGAAVPEQPERGFQRQPLPASVLTTAGLQCQALRLGFASALLLTVMGQLSKRFVVQHVHPSFPRDSEQVRRD